MFEILTASEMKEADTATINGGTPGIRLMESAGIAVAENVKRHFESCPVLILSGPGNNGGDGFIAAAHLKKAGWPVRIACLVKSPALKGDAALAAKQWDGEVETLNSNLSLKDTKLVIDAVFGTGFSGVLAPELVTLFDKIRTKNISVVAVDIPSGIDSTTAAVAAGTLKSTLTVTFTRKKLAHVLLPAKIFCGDIALAHIGTGDDVIASLKTSVFENNSALWLQSFPLPDAASHKFSRGHSVVFGGQQRTGASCLAAHAAQRIGSGLVTIVTTPESHTIYQNFRASIMVGAWQSTDELKSILRDERKNAILIGPGYGVEALKKTAETALAFNKGGVLDADIFTAYKDAPEKLFPHISTKYVLTPHEGEFERFFGALEGSKIERAQKAAKISGANVLLKGADTVIAAPDGTTIVNTNAPSTLATAGAGDVLAGMITGLIAQGMPPFMAAAAACWIHAESARKHGLGLTAEDIIFNISQTLNKIFNISVQDR